MSGGAETKLSLDVLAFYTKECDEIHALLDRVRIPRAMEGAKFSMSQRVAVAVGVLENLMKKVGQPPETQQ